MELKIEVKMEESEAHGKHNVYIAECEGVLYEFDPLQRAMNDCGISAITEENRRDVAKKHLDYAKVGITRARTGAFLRWLVQKAESLAPDEFTAFWESAWESWKSLRQCDRVPESSAEAPSPLPS